jgi:hypothetical protein
MRYISRRDIKRDTKLVCSRYFEDNYKLNDTCGNGDEIYTHKPTNKVYKLVWRGSTYIRVKELTNEK